MENGDAPDIELPALEDLPPIIRPAIPQWIDKLIDDRFRKMAAHIEKLTKKPDLSD
jgi:hypothetical protein